MRLCLRGMVLLGAGVLVGGCAATAELRGKISAVEKQVEQIERNGAYVCAPKELALAKSNIRFAALEIELGHGSRARQHFEIALENAGKADALSPADQCAGPAVIVAELKCVDFDHDGVCAQNDRCPEEPEDFDGNADEDGCPDDDDLDGDGVLDSIDACPLDVEDKDGYLDDDGCPDMDNDADGVLDPVDRCPTDPEDPDGFEDADGCPDKDNDFDKVLDVDDDCPNQMGEVSLRGCPKKYAGVELTATHIRINQTIHFAYNKAVIKKESFWILLQVAKVLKDYPVIVLSVEGHTDSQGGDAYNKQLSTKRAKAVMDFLVKKGGISKARLTSRGWGEERPIDTNLTEDGRAVNRRVEFVRTDVPRSGN
ncbi:MAG: OmpA family protein [Myxococcota bacterium]|nr:OmpA family protein [Myxococcota bacterium]